MDRGGPARRPVRTSSSSRDHRFSRPCAPHHAYTCTCIHGQVHATRVLRACLRPPRAHRHHDRRLGVHAHAQVTRVPRACAWHVMRPSLPSRVPVPRYPRADDRHAMRPGDSIRWRGASGPSSIMVMRRAPAVAGKHETPSSGGSLPRHRCGAAPGDLRATRASRGPSPSWCAPMQSRACLQALAQSRDPRRGVRAVARWRIGWDGARGREGRARNFPGSCRRSHDPRPRGEGPRGRRRRKGSGPRLAATSTRAR